MALIQRGSRVGVVAGVAAVSLVVPLVVAGQAQATGSPRSSSPSRGKPSEHQVQGGSVERRQQPGAGEGDTVQGHHAAAMKRQREAFSTSSWGQVLAEGGKQDVLQALWSAGPGAMAQLVVLPAFTNKDDPAPVRYTVTNQHGAFRVTDDSGATVVEGRPGDAAFDRWYQALFPDVSWARKAHSGTSASWQAFLPHGVTAVAAPDEVGNSALAAVVRERQAHGLPLGFLTEPSHGDLQDAYGGKFAPTRAWQLVADLTGAAGGVHGIVYVRNTAGGGDYLTVAVHERQVFFLDARHQQVDPFLLQRFQLEYLPTPRVARPPGQRALLPAHLPADAWTVMSARQATSLLAEAPVGYAAEAIVTRAFAAAPAPFRVVKTGPDRYLAFGKKKNGIFGEPVSADVLTEILTTAQEHLFFRRKQTHTGAVTTPPIRSWTVMDSPEQAARMVLDSVHSPDRKAVYALIRKVRGSDEYRLFEVVGMSPTIIGLGIKDLVTGREISGHSFSSDNYLTGHLPADYLEGPVHVLRGEDMSIPGSQG